MCMTLFILIFFFRFVYLLTSYVQFKSKNERTTTKRHVENNKR